MRLPIRFCCVVATLLAAGVASCDRDGHAGKGSALGKEVLDEITKPMRSKDEVDDEWRNFVLSRARLGPERFATNDAWPAEAVRLRGELLEEVFLTGQAKKWRAQPVEVGPVGEPLVSARHTVQRLRMRVLDDLWVAAWRYQPREARTSPTPVVVLFMGHGDVGDARNETNQRLAIHLAQQGLYVVVVQQFGSGEGGRSGNGHRVQHAFDLFGTAGVGAFTNLVMKSVDYALTLPHADPKRIATTGLSGGGWQALLSAALDPRVSLAAPVAAMSPLENRAREARSLGDSEQAAPRFHALADYDELAALVAPRPLLLTFNEPDSCCFRASKVVPLMEAALIPLYQPSGESTRLRFHVNEKPGTHNYEDDNRRAFYAFLDDNGFAASSRVSVDENIGSGDLRSEDALSVGMMKEDTGQTLLDVAKATLPSTTTLRLPAVAAGGEALAVSWQASSREQLTALLRLQAHASMTAPIDVAQAVRVSEKVVGDVTVRRMTWRIGDFTVPFVELKTTTTATSAGGNTTIILHDGRDGAGDAIERALADGDTVVVPDLLHMGERKHEKGEQYRAIMMMSLDVAPLAVQVGELRALVARATSAAASSPSSAAASSKPRVTLVGTDERTSWIALVAAALLPDVSAVRARALRTSLRSLVLQDRPMAKEPEAFTPGLGALLDVREVIALVLPRPIIVESKGKSHDARDLEGLEPFARALGNTRALTLP